MVVNKTISLKLVGLDGNAFSLLGAFSRQAKKEGWTEEEINAVLEEAQRDNYSHLVATLSDHCENGGTGVDKDEDWEE